MDTISEHSTNLTKFFFLATENPVDEDSEKGKGVVPMGCSAPGNHPRSGYVGRCTFPAFTVVDVMLGGDKR